MKVLFVTDQAETDPKFDWHFVRENLCGQREVQVDKLSAFVLDRKLNLTNLRDRTRWMARLIRIAGTYDFIVCRENARSARLICVLKRIGLIRNVRLAIADLSFNQGTGLRSRLAVLFTKLFYSVADIILVLSQNQLEYFKNNMLPGNRTKLVRALSCLPDPTLEFMTCKTKNANHYSIGEDFVFSVGESHRDFPLLIAAAAAFPETKFIVMTKDAISDLPSNVSLAEWGPLEEYYALVQRASLIVIPLKGSKNGSGFGVLSEAWALGRPVLIAKTPTISEYVNHEIAYTYQPGNLESLKDSLQQALVDPERRNRVGDNAHRHLLQNHSSKAYFDQLMRHLSKLYLGNGHETS